MGDTGRTRVYVIVRKFGSRREAWGVFASRKSAESRVSERHADDSAFIDIIERPVVGDIANPRHVFIADLYLDADDYHDFTGVYGNEPQARAAVGPFPNQVRMVPIE